MSHNGYLYCMNSPLQCKDSNGTWPNWATKLVVGIAAVAVGAIVMAATAGTAAAFIPAAVAGLKCAVVAGAASAATNVAMEAVETIVEGGTMAEFADDALTAARDGFVDGFMVGGITAGISMAASKPLMRSDGFKIGHTAKPTKGRVEIGYGTPSTKGYTAINVNNSAGKSVFRIDVDSIHAIHAHYGATKKLMNLHRKGASAAIMGIVGFFAAAAKKSINCITN